jgi:hypothetical protein
VDNNSKFKWWEMAALNNNTPWFIWSMKRTSSGDNILHGEICY